MKVFIASLTVACASVALGDTITVTYSGQITVSDVPGVAIGDPLEQAGDGLFLNVDGYNFNVGPSWDRSLTVG